MARILRKPGVSGFRGKFPEGELTWENCRQLNEFNKEYQRRNLAYFLKIKHDWQEQNPGKSFPGVCAEVDSISGVMRPLNEQRA